MAKTTETHHISFVKSLVSNRRNRRGIALEIEDLARQVGEIETEFLVDLFTSDKSYEELYSHLQHQYSVICKRVRYKFIYPNEKWITIKYSKK